jgi:hypothetical protein
MHKPEDSLHAGCRGPEAEQGAVAVRLRSMRLGAMSVAAFLSRTRQDIEAGL